MKKRPSHLIPWFTDYVTKWVFLPLSDWKPLPKLGRRRTMAPHNLAHNRRLVPKRK